MTDVNKLIEKISNFIEKESFSQIEPAGLLCERASYGKFNPSAGHHIVDPVIKDKQPKETKKFSLLERCLREADSSRIGLSNRHLSFFEMFAFHNYGEYSKLPKKENTEKFYHLLTKILGLKKEELLVTILKECEIENQIIKEDETQEIYNIWVKLIGKKNIKRIKGKRNFFIARIPGAAGGTGFEVYYKMSNGKYIEIGSQVAYHYFYQGPMNLHKTVNGTLGSGIGLERVLMALENKTTLYDISLIKPLKDVVIKNLKDGTEELHEDNLNIIADHIRTITFIIYEKEKQNKELTKSQEKILRKFRKNLQSQVDYLGINPKIYNNLVDVMIDLYKDRYPDLFKIRDNVIKFIKPTQR